MMRILHVLIGLLLAIVDVNATINLPVFISSNMVLQRAPQASTIWGTADQSDQIIYVNIDGNESYNASISKQGNWLVTLKARAADPSTVSHTITIQSGGNNQTITLTNVVFGDVWFCSGQSNMEFVLSDSFGGYQEVQQSGQYTRMRMFTVNDAYADTPQINVTSKDPQHLHWAVSAPDVVGGGTWTTFSAVCYYYGLYLYKALNGTVPLGLIASDVGGTPIEAWSSPDALHKCTSVRDAIIYYEKPRLTPTYDGINSQLWNGMVAPFLNMNMMGVIWYQGENNAQPGGPELYSCQFPAMITDWRTKFHNENLYFYFVMIAATPSPHCVDGDFPKIRQAQLSALSLPHVGMGSAIDLGDPASMVGTGPIHPRNKNEVGRRLFLAAWADAYGHGKDVVSVGPLPLSIDFPGTGNANSTSYVVHYASDGSGQGLTLVDTEECTQCCADITAYQIKTAYGWINAVTTISSSTVTISNPMLSSSNPPQGLRYAWLNYPSCVLWNNANLPAIPFNTNPDP